MRLSAVMSAALVAALAVGCGSGAGPTVIATLATAGPPSPGTTQPTSTPSPTATPKPTAPPATATHSPTSTTAPSATPAIPWVEIQPEAAIDVPGTGFIPAFTDGKQVWVVAKDALLKIDPKTNDVVSLAAPVAPDDTTVALADDGLWVARWSGNKLYRLDPKTAQVQLESNVDTPVNIQFVGKDMWIGQESVHSMFNVDRSTGEIDSTSQVEGSAYALPGMGDFWFANNSHVIRVDPATKEVKASIDLTGRSNCARDLVGEFPDSVWTSCFERVAKEHAMARIDPTTNTVAQVLSLPPSHGGSFVEIGDHTWYMGTFDGADHRDFAGFVRIDLATGAMDKFYKISGTDPDSIVSTGDALWIPDEQGHRLLKIDPSALGE